MIKKYKRAIEVNRAEEKRVREEQALRESRYGSILFGERRLEWDSLNYSEFKERQGYWENLVSL